MFKQFKNGIVHGLGIITIIGLVGITYAAYENLSNVSNEELLTSDFFNKVLENQRVFRSEIDSLNLSSGSIPSGAVMAFNSNICPTGWSEYTLAYGRFIRGIDKSGTPIDPEGQRNPGDIQTDEFKAHNHTGNTNTTGAHTHTFGIREWDGGTTGAKNGYNGGPVANKSTSSAGNHSHTLNINNTGGDETRPDNVALLYCIKN